MEVIKPKNLNRKAKITLPLNKDNTYCHLWSSFIGKLNVSIITWLILLCKKIKLLEMKIHVSLLNKDIVCQKQVIIVTTWCQLYTSKKDIFILVLYWWGFGTWILIASKGRQVICTQERFNFPCNDRLDIHEYSYHH